jgi:hypothetical protein
MALLRQLDLDRADEAYRSFAARYGKQIWSDLGLCQIAAMRGRGTALIRSTGRRYGGMDGKVPGKDGARLSSIAYLSRNFDDAKPFSAAQQVLRFAVTEAPKRGLVMELGVFRGGSLRIIADCVLPRTAHGFDSFDGLPEKFGNHPQGTFAVPLPERPIFDSNVELHVGLFEKTLGPFANEYRDDIAFVHIDCDLYSSTKCFFDAFGDRIKPGTILLFDEYFGYDGWEDEEFKAFQEFVARKKCRYTYIAYSAFLSVVAVRIDHVS